MIKIKKNRFIITRIKNVSSQNHLGYFDRVEICTYDLLFRPYKYKMK